MENKNIFSHSDFYREHFEACAKNGLLPARVIAEHKESCIINLSGAEMPAEVTGKFMFTAVNESDYPKTGDYVAAQALDNNTHAIIHYVLPRRTMLSRSRPGEKTAQQVIAANVDTAFIVQGLDGNYNKMRLLRYLSAVKGTGIEAVIVLNKSDINDKAAIIAEETRALVSPVPVIIVSALNKAGLESFNSYMNPGKTSVFLGSSGAGKSTLINALSGRDIALTSEVRESDSRGRHTTVTRQLYDLGSLGLLIDTPGMRELALWAGASDEAAGFSIVDEIAQNCRYRDCTHTAEPGCAVIKAAEDGIIKPEVLRSHFKLKRELEFARSKTDEAAALERKNKERKFGRHIKDVLSHKEKKRSKK